MVQDVTLIKPNGGERQEHSERGEGKLAWQRKKGWKRKRRWTTRFLREEESWRGD